MKKGKKKTKASGLRLRLYVAGGAPNSVLAIANAQAICDEHFPASHELEVVDLLKYPLQAFADGVIATPTLIKLWPGPIQKVIGNLSNKAQVLLVLGTK